jgi:nitrate reductase delta subunit
MSAVNRMDALRMLSALLGYPTQELVDAVPQIARRLGEEESLREDTQNGLAGLLAGLAREDLLDLQERYVAQFDTGRATSLHLFEHVHGDSRDRGQAMVDLNALYERGGVSLAAGELPDYLPAVLEFLSTRPRSEALELLEDCAHILRAVGQRLLGASSPYAAVFAALLDWLDQDALALPLDTRDAEPAPSLDDEWAETPVEFGPSSAPHGAQQSRPPQLRPQFIRFVPRRETKPLESGALHGLQ